MSIYKYVALPSLRSFRLLKLKAGNKNDPLEGELQIYDLHGVFVRRTDVPRFQALSYVWGPLTPSYDFRCNGKLLRITESLRHALCLVRDQRRDILVWADAVCINQEDIRERKQQVDLMRDIYSCARVVSICLNLEEALSKDNRLLLARMMNGRDVWKYKTQVDHRKSERLLLRMMKSGGGWKDTVKVGFEDPRFETSRSSRARNIFSYNHRSILNDLVLHLPSHYWPIIAAFFDNPWFSRIWVVQEVVQSNACRLMFDDQEIPWRNVVYLAQLLARDQGFGARVLRLARTNGIRNVLSMRKETPLCVADPIPALLQQTRDFGSSDPRDKVYAVLHKPLPRTFKHVVLRFLDPWKYIESLLQTILLLYLTCNTFKHDPTESSFWCSFLLLSYVAYLFRFLHLGTLVIWDFGRHLIDFLIKADRALLHQLKYTATIQNTLSLTADYSLPVQTVYKMVAIQAIERSRTLDILSYVNHDNNHDLTFTSWVPQWDVPTQGVNIIAESWPHFQASANTKHSLRRSTRGDDYLVVEGVQSSTVTSMFEDIDLTHKDKQITVSTAYHQILK